MPAIHNLRPMKKAEPMAIGRHSDSPTTKTSAIMPVAHPMSATPSIHLTLSRNAFRVELPVWGRPRAVYAIWVLTSWA